MLVYCLMRFNTESMVSLNGIAVPSFLVYFSCLLLNSSIAVLTSLISFSRLAVAGVAGRKIVEGIDRWADVGATDDAVVLPRPTDWGALEGAVGGALAGREVWGLAAGTDKPAVMAGDPADGTETAVEGAALLIEGDELLTLVRGAKVSGPEYAGTYLDAFPELLLKRRSSVLSSSAVLSFPKSSLSIVGRPGAIAAAEVTPAIIFIVLGVLRRPRNSGREKFEDIIVVWKQSVPGP